MFFEEMSMLFQRMDEAYARAAAVHGFVCAGCEENCCRSLFYHHTLAEYLYLQKGMAGLDDSEQRRIRQAAADADASDGGGKGPKHRMICPLNEAGRCRLYAHRPMICRLHGIPHQLRRPDGRSVTGPGCADFRRRCGADQPTLLDRTPLYAGLAELEKRLRGRSGFQGKIKMTIAQMLAEPPGGIPGVDAGEIFETP